MTNELSGFLDVLKRRYPAETEFHQAATEVSKSVWPYVEKNPKYKKAKVLERMAITTNSPIPHLALSRQSP
jgi:glutamate dehydrogenase (NADP+)